MKQINDTLRRLLEDGDIKTDRTGTGTISKFGGVMRFPLIGDVYPVPTERKVALYKPVEELEWFISGNTHVGWLIDKKNHIWDSWTGQDGTIGPMYGEQWRNWGADGMALTAADYAAIEERVADALGDGYPSMIDSSMAGSAARGVIEDYMAERAKPYAQGGRGGIDQLAGIVNALRNNPDDRRMVVSTWNTALLPNSKINPSANVDKGRMALAPCHAMWQVNTAKLSVRDILFQQVSKSGIVNTGVKIGSIAHTGELYALISTGVRALLKADPIYISNRITVDDLTAEGRKVYDDYFAQPNAPERKLSLMLFARSQDVPLGTVFNVATYSILTRFLAKITNMIPHEYIHVMGDYHIYSNQVDCVTEQLSRSPKRLPQVFLPDHWKELEDFKASELTFEYESHPAIKYPMAAI